jgi:hypothetical protein
MPDSLEGVPFALRMRVKDSDPELYALMGGAPVPAALEAAVISGKLSDIAPQRDLEAEKAQQVAALTATNPFVPGQIDLTRQMRLQQLDPAAAAQQQALAQPYIDQAAANEATRRMQSEQARIEDGHAWANAEATSAARERFAQGIY